MKGDRDKQHCQQEQGRKEIEKHSRSAAKYGILILDPNKSMDRGHISCSCIEHSCITVAWGSLLPLTCARELADDAMHAQGLFVGVLNCAAYSHSILPKTLPNLSFTPGGLRDATERSADDLLTVRMLSVFDAAETGVFWARMQMKQNGTELVWHQNAVVRCQTAQAAGGYRRTSQRLSGYLMLKLTWVAACKADMTCSRGSGRCKEGQVCSFRGAVKGGQWQVGKWQVGSQEGSGRCEEGPLECAISAHSSIRWSSCRWEIRRAVAGARRARCAVSVQGSVARSNEGGMQATRPASRPAEGQEWKDLKPVWHCL
eukprot:1104244-Pelagomonas_calceolata.AAC.1